ncbi:MAG: hypothetical protein HY907_06070 [Deltaproteobacteria bacterium]|nr:hypothetical protein [Deltaproteobacteria bacterium]
MTGRKTSRSTMTGIPWPPHGSSGGPRRLGASQHTFCRGDEAAQAFEAITTVPVGRIKEAVASPPPFPDDKRPTRSHRRSRHVFFPKSGEAQLDVVQQLAAVVRHHDEALHQLEVARYGEANWASRVVDYAGQLRPSVDALLRALQPRGEPAPELLALLEEAGWGAGDVKTLTRLLGELVGAGERLKLLAPADEKRSPGRPIGPFNEIVARLAAILRPIAHGRHRLAVSLFVIAFDWVDDEIRRKVGDVMYYDFDAVAERVKFALRK